MTRVFVFVILASLIVSTTFASVDESDTNSDRPSGGGRRTVVGGWSDVDLTNTENEMRVTPVINFIRYCLNRHGQPQQPKSKEPARQSVTYQVDKPLSVRQQVVAGLKYDVLVPVRTQTHPSDEGHEPSSSVQEQQFVVWDRFGTQMTLLSSSIKDLVTPLSLSGEELQLALSAHND